MAQLFKNNAASALTAGITSGATSIPVANGAAFPSPTGSDYFLLTLIGYDSNGNENAWEIIKVTARASNTLTATRGQEGTTALAWGNGTRVEMRLTAGSLGTMAGQNSNAVAITGGAIDGTAIGATTPSSGAFTTLTASGALFGTSLVASVDTGRFGASGIRLRNPTANSTTGFCLMPAGASGQTYIRLYNADDTAGTNTGALQLTVVGAAAAVDGLSWGSGTAPTSITLMSNFSAHSTGATILAGKNMLLQNAAGNSNLALWNSGGSGASVLSVGSGSTWGTWDANTFNVTAQNGTSGNEYAGLRVGCTSSPTRTVSISYDNANDCGVITAIHAGTAWKSIALQPVGGNVTLPGSGYLLLGGSAASARLGVKGTTADSTTYNIYSQNSSGTLLFGVRNDGYLNVGVGALSPYNNTTATAANLVVDSNGSVFRSTSSVRFKTDIEDLQPQYADSILAMRPIWYRSTSENDRQDWSWYGLIAEEIAEIDRRFVLWGTDEAGELRPDGVQYERLVVPLIAKAKDHESRITGMEGNWLDFTAIQQDHGTRIEKLEIAVFH